MARTRLGRSGRDRSRRDRSRLDPDHVRIALRGGSVLLLVAGLAAAVFGLIAPSQAPDEAPERVTRGRVVTLPERSPLFGGRAVVYGDPTGSDRPTDAELDCVLTDAEGLTLGGASTSAVAALREDRRVIDERGLVPLLVVADYPGGAALTCAGVRVATSAPVYVVAVNPLITLVPMASFSFAALALPLGALGVFGLRRR